MITIENLINLFPQELQSEVRNYIKSKQISCSLNLEKYLIRCPIANNILKIIILEQIRLIDIDIKDIAQLMKDMGNGPSN